MTMKANVGFEWGTILEDQNLSIGSGVLISSTQKRQGNYSLRIQGAASAFIYWGQLAFSALSEFYLQFAIFPDTSPTSTMQCFAWRKGTTVLGGLIVNHASGMIEVWLGNFATKLGEFPYTVGAWQIIELHIKIADAGGVIQARKDMGALAVDFSGDTQPGADATVDNIKWGTWNGINLYLDDIILNDTAGTKNNSWPGGLRIIRLAPAGDGGTLQFTPTPSGDHYSAVDEVPPSGADNLIAASSALVDVLTLEDCPADVYSVAAAQPMAFGLKGSSNPPTRLALGLRLSATDYYSADLDLAVSQAVAKDLLEVSPDTAVPFTFGELNGAELLLKSAD